ncbi:MULTISPECIES: type 1 glutamine amidotransferase domain-containing protein [Sphingobacterium]|uniref:Molecular chaperone Hsp31 and glyoxalase 3 n=1 Tax=Sphingobacterium multivorum TaxID=28454 RepID=A0A2X2J9C6_SPHMU|nr:MULTISPECIES: type 1 glutamine amidotransferase domain-containing protein [Sphingobacterium]SPZ83645.1 Molecular chaperone Hsp31 and glyoxalase 3 [Sphingobacterium multivorum]
MKSRDLFQQKENLNDMKAKQLFIQIGLFLTLFTLIVPHCYATNRKPKILFVVTSHDTKGNTGEKTGYYLGEVSHPWEVLTAAGYEIDFLSPQGGNPPVDGFDLTDPVNKKFWEDKYYHNKITHSLKPSQVKPEDYKAIFYAGGHGAMWDLPFDSTIAKIASKIYEANGVVAAVCHGPAGLINIKLKSGEYLIKGKKVNGFSNEEEELVKLSNVVPFLLEDKLKAIGGIYEKSEPWQSHVTIDGRLITGQNPQSAKAIGMAIVKALSK